MRHYQSGTAWFAVLLFGAVAACDLVVDVNRLDDGKCADGTKPCPGLGKCVALDKPETGCADTSCAPCALPHAVATCTDGACAISSCLGDYWDCDPNNPGCETDLAHDPDHCDGCMNKCQVKNGLPGCSGRRCTVAGCDLGYVECAGPPITCATTCP